MPCSHGTCSLESHRRPEGRLERAGGADEAALVALHLGAEAAQVLQIPMTRRLGCGRGAGDGAAAAAQERRAVGRAW